MAGGKPLGPLYAGPDPVASATNQSLPGREEHDRCRPANGPSRERRMTGGAASTSRTGKRVAGYPLLTLFRRFGTVPEPNKTERRPR
jgi:hypothetical protein